MAEGYKIRTDDGSEVGPMSLESVEGWFKQGLVRHDNLVQRPGSYNWVPLSEVLARDLKKAVLAKKAPAPVAPPAQARPRPPAVRPEPHDRPSRAASASTMKGLVALLLLAALAGGGFAAYRAFFQAARDEPKSPAPVEPPPPDAGEQAKATEAVMSETPQFSRAAVELLFSHSAANRLEPQEAFRRGQTLVGRGIPSLSAAESRELGALMQAVYGTLPGRDQARLGAYLDRLKNGLSTKPEEDRPMALAMKTGVLKLSKERRARLQALFEKALRAGAARR